MHSFPPHPPPKKKNKKKKKRRTPVRSLFFLLKTLAITTVKP